MKTLKAFLGVDKIRLFWCITYEAETSIIWLQVTFLVASEDVGSGITLQCPALHHDVQLENSDRTISTAPDCRKGIFKNNQKVITNFILLLSLKATYFWIHQNISYSAY